MSLQTKLNIFVAPHAADDVFVDPTKMEYWRGSLDVLDPNLFPDSDAVMERLEHWSRSRPINQTSTEQGTTVRQIDVKSSVPQSEVNKMIELWTFIRHYLTKEMAELIADLNYFSYTSFDNMRRVIARAITVILDEYNEPERYTGYME